LDKTTRTLLFARLVDKEGYCRKHGLTINYCKDCFNRLYPDLDTPSNLLGETTQRHVMRDGELTATIEIERPRQRSSGRLFYNPITRRTSKLGILGEAQPNRPPTTTRQHPLGNPKEKDGNRTRHNPPTRPSPQNNLAHRRGQRINGRTQPASRQTPPIETL